jgi:hypothetical protein
MTDVALRRFTGIAGIIFVLLSLVTVSLITDIPSTNAAPHPWATYVASHGPQLLGEVFVWSATASVTIAFLTGLWGLLRRTAPEAKVAAMIGLGAGILTWAIALAGLAPLLEQGYRAGTLDETVVKSLADLGILGAMLSAFPTALSIGAFAYLISRTGVVARWIGWLGFVVVAAHLIAAGSFAQDGPFSPSVFPIFVAPPLYYTWTLLASIALLLKRAAPAK